MSLDELYLLTSILKYASATGFAAVALLTQFLPLQRNLARSSRRCGPFKALEEADGSLDPAV